MYVDNCISLAISQCKNDLDHLAGAILHGIHGVFPEDNDNEEDPALLKKMQKGDGKWAVKKRYSDGYWKALARPSNFLTKEYTS